jgi:triphosphoribosyl-dephospho-CoA synthase
MRDAGLSAQIACIWEATARKPGNVHRYRDFADTTYTDFLLSAAAIAPAMASARHQRVGTTILDAVMATRRVVRSNTNLGIVLLLAPLATTASMEDEDLLRQKLEWVLAELDVVDTRLVYEAIRLASPGGLGRAAEQDVYTEPTQTLREVMALAADRDLIARQYANDFTEVFDEGVPALGEGLERTGCIEGAIIFAHLQLLARLPDTLIARKRGRAEAEEASKRAAAVLAAGWPSERAGRTALAELDTWLRAIGNARNPGATADLLTACLFVLLRQNRITLPLQFPWPAAGFDHD